MKPKLLIVELWGLGDLAIATPFLRAASAEYQVTLLAKPYARELQPHLWPGVQVKPFVAPWTALRGKYRLLHWPWRQFFRLRRELRAEDFTISASSRWDMRDHVFMYFVGVRERAGFPHLGSKRLLTRPLVRPDPASHRYEQWRVLGRALGFSLPVRPGVPDFYANRTVDVVVHSGAARSFCIWPLEHFQKLVARLRAAGYSVRVLCDPGQRTEWIRLDERAVVAPDNVTELMGLLDAHVFIGNDSGPGHLAAMSGVPTFTLFGPHLPENWQPLHPEAAWNEGRPCPYKPCEVECSFSQHHCMVDVGLDEAWEAIASFVLRHCARR